MYCITRLPRASQIHSGLPSASSLVKVRMRSSRHGRSAEAARVDRVVRRRAVVRDGDDLAAEAVEVDLAPACPEGVSASGARITQAGVQRRGELPGASSSERS